MLEQLSVYTENKKGAARQMLSILAEKDINVLGFLSTDSGEFGVIRMLLSDTDKAYEMLTENGYLCRKNQVIGIELSDNPGAMEKLLLAFEEMNLNVDYIYIGYNRSSSSPIILLHTEEMDIASAALESKGYVIC